MSYWNYRVIRCTSQDAVVYEIREVYYDDNRVTGWTMVASEPFGETLEELRDDLRAMTRCLGEGILDLAELEAAGANAKAGAGDDNGDQR